MMNIMTQGHSAVSVVEHRRHTHLVQTHQTEVHITGVGLLTPLGSSVWATFGALLNGRTITDNLDVRLRGDKDKIDRFALVKGVGSIRDGKMGAADPSVALAHRALTEACISAGIETDGSAAMRDLPIVLASSKGAVGALLQQVTSLEAFARSPHGYLCHYLKQLTGCISCQCVVAACTSGLFALEKAQRMIRRGEARRVAVVGVESALVPLFIASYSRMGVMPELTADHYRCKPLDQSRCGFALNEIAAAVILEGAGDESNRTENTIAHASSAHRIHPMRLLGVKCLAEANHLVKPSPTSDALHAIADWAFGSFGPIDVLHPHATGTVENDEHEMNVYADAWATALAGRQDSQGPPAYACKGSIGHGLGASTLASMVIACLIARTGKIPPMPWLTEPVDTPFQLNRNATTSQRQLNRHAIFGEGFGGHVAGAVIEKVDAPRPR